VSLDTAYVFDSILEEAKWCVRGKLNAALMADPMNIQIDSSQIVDRLKDFMEYKASVDERFAAGLKESPVGDDVLHGLVSPLIEMRLPRSQSALRKGELFKANRQPSR